ncbi:hypothetical protein J6590_097206, partial [Homalodisca vitripennis]
MKSSGFRSGLYVRQTARAWTLSGTDCTRGILGASLTVRSTRTSLPCVTTRLVRYCGVTDLI